MVSIIHRAVDSKNNFAGWMIYCPACEMCHLFDKRWTLTEGPTFRPSMRVTYYDENGKPTAVCHSHVTNGKIEFCNDSTHRFAGQTIPLEPF